MLSSVAAIPQPTAALGGFMGLERMAFLRATNKVADNILASKARAIAAAALVGAVGITGGALAVTSDISPHSFMLPK